MKKPIFVFCTFLSSIFFLNAQTTNTFPDSGNVGVGTLTPSYKLDVLGTGRFSGTLWANDKIVLANNKLLTFVSYNYFDFYIGSDANKDALHIGYGNTIGANNQMTFDQTTNRVGIYNSSPSYTLDVTGTGRFTSNLLIGNPNGARTEINTSTNHKIFAPTNKKTVDIDGNFHGGGYVGVYRADTGQVGVQITSKSDPAHYNNSLSIEELRLDSTNRNAIKLSSAILSGDTEPTNFMHMPYPNSVIVIGEWGSYKKGLGYGLINKLKTSFENDVYVETGNVGIGTTSPAEKLHVNGLIRIPSATNEDNNSPGIVAQSNDDFLYDGQYLNHYGFGFHGYQDGSGTYVEPMNTYMSGYFGVDFFTSGQNRMRISNDGIVSIGTVNRQIGYKLAVNGNIKAKEIKVETGWSDFVFESNYNLPTLKEVEQHIKEKGHLKDIPSAKEVAENGILLGDMNAKLLQKIEELTLYTIEQEKQLEKQEIQIKQQDEVNQELKDRLLKIELLLSKN